MLPSFSFEHLTYFNNQKKASRRLRSFAKTLNNIYRSTTSEYISWSVLTNEKVAPVVDAFNVDPKTFAIPDGDGGRWRSGGTGHVCGGRVSSAGESDRTHAGEEETWSHCTWRAAGTGPAASLHHAGIASGNYTLHVQHYIIICLLHPLGWHTGHAVCQVVELHEWL